MLIRVYCGPGVGERSLAAVLEALRDESSAAVVTLNAEELLQSASWEQDCCCLVFPGGRDVPYLEALAGAGCARIRRYVEGGGSYLGLCAGAYFGSAYCEFERCGAAWIEDSKPALRYRALLPRLLHLALTRSSPGALRWRSAARVSWPSSPARRWVPVRPASRTTARLAASWRARWTRGASVKRRSLINTEAVTSDSA